MQLSSVQSLLYSMRLSTVTQAIVEKGIRSCFGVTTKLHGATRQALSAPTRRSDKFSDKLSIVGGVKCVTRCNILDKAKKI